MIFEHHKAQIMIPKSTRDSLRMKAGDRMTFTLMPDGVVLVRVTNRHVSELAGLYLARDTIAALWQNLSASGRPCPR
jgi:AbrB family looped-hinge helix DNA binding protein